MVTKPLGVHIVRVAALCIGRLHRSLAANAPAGQLSEVLGTSTMTANERRRYSEQSEQSEQWEQVDVKRRKRILIANCAAG
jgi:hypothetical protein